MPLLEGLDGINKMSKSLNNYIGIDESHMEIFEKLMSISDDLMWKYYELLSFSTISQIKLFKKEVINGKNPREFKVKFAQEIVERYHGKDASLKAHLDFEDRFKNKLIPENIPEYKLNDSSLNFTQILKISGLTSSTSDSISMIEQGAVKINGEKIKELKEML